MKQYIALLLTISVIFMTPGSIFSQTTPSDSSHLKHRIGFHFGLEHNLYLDELATPLIYKGNGIQLGLDYYRQNIKSQLNISVDYAHLGEIAKYHQDRTLYITPLEYIPEVAINGDTTLHARINPSNLSHIGLRIAYYRKIIPNRAKRITTYFGGSFASNARIPSSNSVIIFTPIWLNEFNIVFKSSCQFNSSLKFSVGAELPVFSVAARLPYSISPVEPNKGVYISALSNGKVVTWNKYQSANAFLAFDYTLNRRTILQLNLACYYLRYSYPKSIHFLQTNSTIGISYLY